LLIAFSILVVRPNRQRRTSTKNYLLASAGRAAELAAELADQYLVMARGEIIARGLGRDMQTDGVRERVAICST